jgi:hypothetical protein
MYFEDMDDAPPPSAEDVIYDPGASLFADDEEAGKTARFSYDDQMEGIPENIFAQEENIEDARRELWVDPLHPLNSEPLTEDDFRILDAPVREHKHAPAPLPAPTQRRFSKRSRAPSAAARDIAAANTVHATNMLKTVPPPEQGGAFMSASTNGAPRIAPSPDSSRAAAALAPDSSRSAAAIALNSARAPAPAPNQLRRITKTSDRASTIYLDRSDIHPEIIGAMVNNVTATFPDEPKSGYQQGAPTTQPVPMSKNQLIDPEPRNRREAQASKFWPEYYQAEKVEFAALLKNGTFKMVKKSDVPKYAKLLKHKWVYKDKKDDDGVVNGAKARLTAMGCGQREGLDYNETYASTMNIRTFRCALALFNLDPTLQMLHWDVSNAYLHARLKEKIYMTQPTGHEIPNTQNCVYKLEKSLYGLKQAGREWQQYLRDILINDCDFEVLKADEACYMLRKGDSWIMMCTFVDDIFPLTNDPKLLEGVFANLCKKCTIKNMGDVTCALRTNIEYDREEGILKLSNAPYIKEIIKRFGMEKCKIAHTPMDPTDPLSPEDWPKSEEEKAEIMRKYPFRELLGCLWWPTWMSRPDILVAVHEASKHVDKPSIKLWKHLTRIVRYLAYTQSLGVVMKRPDSPSAQTYINAFVDGDWGACLKSRKSRTGGLIEVHGQLVIWFSSMQTATALSTSESEFYGIVTISKVLLWLRNVIEAVHKPVEAPIPIWCDNQAAVSWSYDLPFAKRAKHLDLRLHVMKEWTAHKIVKPEYMPGDIMPADFLTKPLARDRFEELRDRVMGPPKYQNHFLSQLAHTPLSKRAPTPMEEASATYLSALRRAYNESSPNDLPIVAQCATLFAHEILTTSQAGMITGASLRAMTHPISHHSQIR